MWREKIEQLAAGLLDRYLGQKWKTPVGLLCILVLIMANNLGYMPDAQADDWLKWAGGFFCLAVFHRQANQVAVFPAERK